MQSRQGRIGSHVYIPPHESNASLNPFASEASESARGVTSLLHNLRGEQFRHARNRERVRHNPSDASALSSSSWPLSLDYSESHDDKRSPRAEAAPAPRPIAAGPVPKSWRKQSEAETTITEGPSWRAKVLSVVFEHLPDSSGLISYLLREIPPASSSRQPSLSSSFPPLSALCFRVVLSLYASTSDFEEELVPCLAPHLRRDLLRHSSIHSPLQNSKLYTLCEEGHADGELIVIGPCASLRSDLWGDHANPGLEPSDDAAEEDEEEWSWDSPGSYDPYDSPLQTLILLSTPFGVSTFLTLPPTLTHLALLDIPSSIPLHRLPGICPLLVVLDLSYNKWIGRPGVGEKALSRVEWNRFRRLEVLGLRRCLLEPSDIASLNKSRWVDVQVILDT